MFEQDYGFECSMCGKPMTYRYCGMCVSCEQIDNSVPGDYEYDAEYSPRYNSVSCPKCGASVWTKILWTDGDIAELQDTCNKCEWESLPYVE